ncbi:hypothetical protein J3A83DRAFT_3254823 [Scleroderma citrinum]
MQQAVAQPYHAQNKGTLSPGQTISVNKYSVQIERYLSQGGFSHVYLVRTPTPVYNTTHHVLKRIAVANEAMLAEVKKEVDIMRILQGHPNIVHLIDAAWHRMSNGQYEVFILMEFCPGGGIIDMMNRRLRERLTEAEILQIFVDVCEGVAAMHNLRPPLLHRDLKVENILQSSPTTFKLCDFGSATPVALRPPATTQEIRALEADLNRHTTLQYRAPEMIDPHLRRPVDEKSDVWALGVLLYKLCYYTTPFEEHGPLAILNVQYRIPPYPVYSPQLNALIVAMLREHGTQRPTVFELLDQVHCMRGTKSRFSYHIPPSQPLSPRVIQHHPSNPLDNVVSTRPKSSNTQTQPIQRKDVTPGIQAGEKVLEAITTPARRGRPSSGHQKESALSTAAHPPSPTVGLSPTATRVVNRDWLADEEDKAWRALRSSIQGTGGVKVQKSGGLGWSAWKPKHAPHGGTADISPPSRSTEPGPRTPTTAFGDNFLWHAGDSAKAGSSTGASATPKGKITPSKLAPPPDGSRSTKVVVSKGKDAFDGLGLPTAVSQPPTLGEARKLRTGLATIGEYHRASVTPNPSFTAVKSSSPSFRPTPSPRLSLSYAGSSWGSSPSLQPIPLANERLPELSQPHDVSVESRFPSVEEIDATFTPAANPYLSSSHADSSLENKINISESPALSHPSRHQHLIPSSLPQRNARSEQTTGSAVRDMNADQRGLPLEGVDASLPKRRSLSVKAPLPLPGQHTARAITQLPPAQKPVQTTQEPEDWLTGEINGQLSLKEQELVDIHMPETPVLREFTKKRSSFIEENTARIPSPQEGITGRQLLSRMPTPPSLGKTSSRRPMSQERDLSASAVSSMSKEPDILSHTSIFGTTKPLSRYQVSTAEAVAVEMAAEGWRTPPIATTRERKLSSSDEDSPENAIGLVPSGLAGRGSVRGRRGRQSSVHDLVDLWGGGVVQTKERLKDATQESVAQGFSEEVEVNLLKGRPTAVPSTTKPRASSPQRMQARPSQSGGNVEFPRSPSRTSDRRSPPSHTKQSSTVNSSIPPAPPSSYTRPQSLLLFSVTKSISDGNPDAPPTPGGLSIPQDGSRKNGTRRTSITDMVQRYEAINASVKVGGHGPSLSLPKSPSLKLGPQTTSSGPTTRPAQPSIHSPSVARFNSLRPAEDPSPSKDADKRVPPSALTTTSSADLSSQVIGLPNGSRSRLLSSSTSGRLGTIDGLPFPSLANKAIAPSEDQRRSPSPEKPYRGVGKLIDQWQKKSEEAESVRSHAPRKGYIAKRAGFV